MRNNLKVFCFAVLTILISCNSSNNNKEQTVQNTPKDFAKTYSGQLGGKLDIIMDITAINGQINGKYFYKTIGQDIQLKGDLKNDNSFIVNEFDALGNETGVFTGKLVDARLIGSWKKPNGNSRPVLIGFVVY